MQEDLRKKSRQKWSVQAGCFTKVWEQRRKENELQLLLGSHATCDFLGPHTLMKWRRWGRTGSSTPSSASQLPGDLIGQSLLPPVALALPTATLTQCKPLFESAFPTLSKHDPFNVELEAGQNTSGGRVDSPPTTALSTSIARHVTPATWVAATATTAFPSPLSSLISHHLQTWHQVAEPRTADKW